MPLPWLIGAAVVALGAAAVSVLNDDDDSGSGGDSDEERRRKKRAEQERKARAHKEKLKSMENAFTQEGMQRGNDLIQSLEGQIKVTLLGDRPFKDTLVESGSKITSVLGVIGGSSEAAEITQAHQQSISIFKELQTNNKNLRVRVKPTYLIVDGFELLPQEIQNNLVNLMSLYDVEFEKEATLKKVLEKLKKTNHELHQLKTLRQTLGTI